jgi:hypothetical protein
LKKPASPHPYTSLETSYAREIEEYFRTILESGRIQNDLSSSFTEVTNQSIQEQAPLDEARSLAAGQARESYKCETCGLEFSGILAFATHDEETGHMKNRSKHISIPAHVGHDLAYRGFIGSY